MFCVIILQTCFRTTNNNNDALVLSEALDTATDLFLDNRKSPSRKVNELDNRGSHFYLTLYWAQALAKQEKSNALKERFTPIAATLENNEEKIISELNDAQGKPVDIGGYFEPSEELTSKAMRPSRTFNDILNML